MRKTRLKRTPFAILTALLLASVTVIAADAPAVKGKLKDQLQTDDDTDNKVDRGDVIRYEAEVDNTAGTGAATSVVFDATLDADSTLDAASIKVTPIAVEDVYTSPEDTVLNVNAAGGLLNNDFDPKDANPPTNVGMTVTSGVFATSGGGSVTVNADGSFNYTPLAGFSGTDTFNYTSVDSDAMTDIGSVSIVVSGKIWFVDDSAAPGGDGSKGLPFNDFSALNGAGGVGDSDAAGDTIYLFEGTYPATLELENTQILIGAGVELAAGGTTIVPPGTAPTYNGTVQLANDNVIQGMAFTPSSGFSIVANGGTGGTVTNSSMITSGTGGAINLVGQAGTFVYSGDFSGTSTGNLVTVNGGNPIVQVTGNMQQTGGRLIDVQNTTGGSLTVNGTLASTNGSAINIQNNSGNPAYQFGNLTVLGATSNAVHLANNGAASYTFSGDFNLTTANGNGLFANSGTITLADVNSFNNSVNATGGAALNLSGVAIGSFGFDSLASVNSPVEGVNLNNLTGAMTVLGNIDITNPTGRAINIAGGSATYTLNGGTTTINGRNDGAIWIDSVGAAVTFAQVNVGALSSGIAAAIRVFNTANGVTFGSTTVADSGGFGLSIVANSGGVDFSSINIGSAGNIASAGVNISSTNSGTINLGSGSINNTLGAALNINSGTANINYSGTMTQSNNAALVSVVGHGIGTLALSAGALSATNGDGLQFNNADGIYNLTGAVTLNGGNAGLDITNGSSGTITLANTSITNPTGVAINIDGSSANLNYNAGVVSQTNPAPGLVLNSNTGGTITLAPNLTFNTSTANAIAMTTNSGSAINLSGQLDIDTTTGKGFTATGGGTLTLTNANNTVNTSTGQLVSLNGVIIGAAGVDFSSAVAAGFVTTDGVNLTGVTGGNFVLDSLSVAGSAAAIDGIEINTSSANAIIASATIDNTGGAGINLTGSNGTVTFTTVDIDGNTGAGVQITNNTSPVNINGGTVGATNDPAGNAFDISGGSGNITMAAAITNATARSVDITGRTTGIVTISGNISDTGTGINVANNTGGATNFSGSVKTINTGTNTAINLTNNSQNINFLNGGLDIDTTSGLGFNANAAGTVNVSGANNTINSTTGTALNVVGTTIGASDLNFVSISANGATNGIVLNTTGASGGLTVTGDGGGTTVGGNNSGGQLQNTSIAMLLNNTRDVSIRDMRIANSTFHHIDASTVTNLTLNEVNLQTAGVGTTGQGGMQGVIITNLNISNSIFNAGGNSANEHGIAISNLRGTSTIQSSTFSNSGTIQFFVQNTSATSTMNFYGNTFNLHSGAFFGDNLSVEAAGTSVVNLNVGDGTVGNANTFDTGQDGVQAVSSSSGTMNVVINRNTRTNGTGTGFNVGAFNNADITFDINNNTITDAGSTGINANSVNTTNATAVTGHIRNNTITRVGRGGTGFYINHIIEGAGTGTTNIQNNIASGGTGNPNINGDSGIRVQARDPSNAGNLTMNVTINNNTVSDTGFRAIEVESGSSAGGTGETVCLNMLNNSATTAFGDAGYRVRQRPSSTFNLQNFAGNGAASGDITSWINTTKSNTGTTSVSIGSAFGTSGSCATPP